MKGQIIWQLKLLKKLRRDKMGGKYEVRYYTENNYRSEYTNSWFHFMKLRLTKKVIYYKVIKD